MSGAPSDPGGGRRRLTALAVVAAAMLTSACVAVPDLAAASSPQAEPTACPESLAGTVRCFSVRDAAGAWIVVALPDAWNRRLIVHAHGGPRMGPPEAADSLEDLDRFSSMVRQGYAWVGSSYRRGGYGVRSAAEDVDRSRAIFSALFSGPERTLLHGQSWGANVAAKTAELHGLGEDGARLYDGVLLTNGVVNGGTRAYQFRADLRAVYQYFCGNHPAPDEPQYPVWQGLPAGVEMTRAEVARRVAACAGAGLPPETRSPDQARRLAEILAVTGLSEDNLVAHMSWATLQFQDLVQVRLGGRNPFDNTLTVYEGSSDDAALNAGIERFAADPEAVAMLAHDADLTGELIAPTLTVHALHDPVVPHAAEAVYAETVSRAGRSGLLLQATTDEREHSRLLDATYLTALAALERWIDTGERPDPTELQAHCLTQHPHEDCRFVTDD